MHEDNNKKQRHFCCTYLHMLQCFALCSLIMFQSAVLAQSRCQVSATNDADITVWNNGAGSRWQAPAAVGGGVRINTGNRVEINSTSPYGKIKFAARNPMKGVTWLAFGIRAISPAKAKVSVYLYTPRLGDTFTSRCTFNISSNWRTIRVPISAFGANAQTEMDQIRFRNDSSAPIRFQMNRIALGGDTLVTDSTDTNANGSSSNNSNSNNTNSSNNSNNNTNTNPSTLR